MKSNVNVQKEIVRVKIISAYNYDHFLLFILYITVYIIYLFN